MERACRLAYAGKQSVFERARLCANVSTEYPKRRHQQVYDIALRSPIALSAYSATLNGSMSKKHEFNGEGRGKL